MSHQRSMRGQPKSHQRSLRHRTADESGLVLAWMALLLTVLLGMAGFAVDLGLWYSRGYQLQRSADAAALAGVVWMPDLDAAVSAATAVLARNGVSPGRVNGAAVSGGDSDISVTIERNPADPNRRLSVSVVDDNVAAVFAKPFLHHVTETRNAVSEYVLPVPLGSPTNYLGAGPLLGENLFAAVNGFCTSREDGDEILSRFDGTKPAYGGQPANRCPSGVAAPAGTGPNGYSEDNLDSAPDHEGGVYLPPDLTGPTYTGGGYGYYVELPSGHGEVRVALYDAPFFTTGSPFDNRLGLSSPTVTTSFRLRSADGTVLDDADNAIYGGCSGAGETNPRSFATNQSVFTTGLLIGTGASNNRWTRFCTIPAAAPAGRYILEVWTMASQATSVGVNAYGVFLQKGSSTAACDSRTDSTCPRVFGKDRLSVYANQSSSHAEFYLAEVENVHAGKDMVISLWDPGEGGNTLQILDPNGSPATFDYRTKPASSSGTGRTSLDVSGTGTQPGPSGTRSSTSRFNDRVVELTVHLPSDYDTRYGTKRWWKISYDFASGTVTDRTTWSVQIVGNPVRLVPEE